MILNGTHPLEQPGGLFIQWWTLAGRQLATIQMAWMDFEILGYCLLSPIAVGYLATWGFNGPILRRP